MTTGQSCATCRAFRVYQTDNDTDLGECRRHPPVLTPSQPCQSLWPEVKADDWCCEWLPQPVAQTTLQETPL